MRMSFHKDVEEEYNSDLVSCEDSSSAQTVHCVDIVCSPVWNTHYENQLVQLTLHTGATANMICESAAHKFSLTKSSTG